MYIADAHCDTLSGMLGKGLDFGANSLQIDLLKLREASQEGYLQFFAMFASPSLPLEENRECFKGMRMLFDDMAEAGQIKPVLKRRDAAASGIKGLLAAEGIYFSGGDPGVVDTLFEDGVRCMSLTWNPDNGFSGGILGESGSGLTAEGRKAVTRALELGMLMDVSHISDRGFYDIAGIASAVGKPFAATHSNARKLCGHPRNLDDGMLRQIASSGGFAGINVFSCFLNDNCEADEEDVVRHIEYICGLIGADFVGFGSDFDGIDRKRSAVRGPSGINGILEKLLKLNYSESDVGKIASGNILRVLGSVLPEV